MHSGVNLIITLSLDEGKVVRVSGPASIEVLSGELLISGASFPPPSKLIISRFRSYGVKAVKRSELKVILGDGGSVEEPREGEEVVDAWLDLCSRLLNYSKPLRVIILGPTESGKTSLTAFIANQLISKGREVYVVDTDVGQEDIAIPCTIGVARPTNKFIWLRELQPIKIKFVGCTSPQYCLTQYVTAFQEVVSGLINSGSDLIVNTDGWVTGPSALELKQLMIKLMRPTHVYVLSDEIYEYIRNSLRGSNIEVVLVPRPKVVRERSRDDRRFLRQQAYSKLLSNVRRIKLAINNIVMLGSCLLSGRRLDVNELINYVKLPQEACNNVLYASIYGNTLNLVLRRGTSVCDLSPYSDNLELNVINEGDERGLLVGILDGDLRDVGVGIIDSVNYVDGNIYVLTSWNGSIGGLILGKVKLNEKYEEVSRVSKCLL